MENSSDMETANQKIFRDTLVNMGLLGKEELEIALKEQGETGEKLSNILVKLGYISREDLTKALASHFLLSSIELKEYNPPQDVIRLVPPTIARKYKLLPLKKDRDTLTVALSDPLDFLVIENLEKIIDFKINPFLAKEQELENKLIQFYGVSEETITTLLTEISESSISFAGIEAADEEEIVEEAPIIRLINMLIVEAFKNRASDIHIEPSGRKLRIRYRIDGVLQEVQSPPKKIQASVVSRIKTLSGMDITEKRLPQDGRILANVAGKELDLRVSALPGLHGESIVMRILDRSSLLMGLGELGFLPEDEKIWKEVIRSPNGIILVTGPTGSGKTTTLYAVLAELNTPDKKIITVEDPVEYRISGINQVQIKPDIDLTFANCLKNLLRQAPDVIMIGEIRDNETAEIATRAALTGHLVFSTLHTNDAASAITRLIDMGIKPFLVSSSLQAVMAQRLVRKICKKCAEPHRPPKEIIEIIKIEMGEEMIKNTNFRKGRGCKECNNTGFKGRIGIFELLVMSEPLQKLAMESVPSRQIRNEARGEGMKILREDGWIKACQGITTSDEVIEITQSDVTEAEMIA